MDVREKKVIAVQAKFILEQSKKLQNKAMPVFDKNSCAPIQLIISQINTVIKYYNQILPKINPVFTEEGCTEKLEGVDIVDYDIDLLRKGTLPDTEAPLIQVIYGCTTVISFLEIGIEISTQTIDKLSSITKELLSIKSKLPPNVYENLVEAKDEFEKGGFLGSSLISGKVINACLNSVPGKDINERIALLKAHDLVRDNDGRDFLLKASHFGRNITSHDISIFPTSSEAIVYLGDAIKIAVLISEFNKKNLAQSSTTVDKS